MTYRLGLIDYGMGNMHSVQKAFGRLNQNLNIVRSPNDLQGIDALVLPGVGAFDPAMDQLTQTGLVPYLKSWSLEEKKPLLGICLGLQLLFESSDEGVAKGLGLFKGHIRKLPSDQNERIPHMGWSVLRHENSCPLLDLKDKDSWMYFVHSYVATPNNRTEIAASVEFGNTQITAIVWKDKLGACQFHPEKSSIAGHRMLSRWLNWIRKESK